MPLILQENLQFGVVCLTLNRPEKCNSLTIALLKELGQQLHSLATKERIVILRGAGNNFCTGMDLHEASHKDLRDELMQQIRETLLTIVNSPLITIAAVHGLALAGGAGLLAACDLVLATPETQVGFPELRRGLIPAQVATLLLRQIPLRDVRELLLVGARIDVKRAHEMRLVTHIAALADLLPLAQHLADEILKNGPEATKATKKLLNTLTHSNLEEELDFAMNLAKEQGSSVESQEGVQAFLEKREAKWV